MHYEGQITQKHHTIGLFHPLNRDKLVTFEGNNSFLLKLQTCSHFSESQWQVQQRLGDNRSATLGFRFGRHDGGHLRIWHWCYDVLKKSEMLVLVEVEKSMQKISLFFLFVLNVCLILKGHTKEAERFRRCFKGSYLCSTKDMVFSAWPASQCARRRPISWPWLEQTPRKWTIFSPEKEPFLKGNVIFQPSIFSKYVNFQRGNSFEIMNLFKDCLFFGIWSIWDTWRF